MPVVLNKPQPAIAAVKPEKNSKRNEKISFWRLPVSGLNRIGDIHFWMLTLEISRHILVSPLPFIACIEKSRLRLQ